MPHDVVLDQLPNQVELNDQIIRIRYSPIIDDEGNLQRVLVIMHDITRQERAERKHAQDAEKLQVLMHVMNDRAGLGDCMEQTSDLLDQLQATTQDPLACKRHLHTLKGNVGMYDMQSMMACCHQIETRLQVNNTSVSLKDIEELREKWRYYEELVQPFYQADCAPSREAAQLKDIAGLIEQRAPYARLASTAASWNQESMALRLARLARQTQHTARRLEHQVDTCIQDNGLFTPLHTLDSLWAVVPHLIRNALDHGIEDPDVRAALGKPARGRIVLATRRAADTFVLSIRDDGAGIQWQALRDKAMKLGMPHTSRSELEAVLFADGISSKDTVSQFSGRGVGMAAVLQETVRRGGTVSVHSEPNVGTTIECAIPGIFHSMERMVG